MSQTFEQLLAKTKPEIVERARAKADVMLLEIRLAELRKQAEFTQKQLADIMGVKQPTVAGIEKSGQDIKLSTLKKYVDSLGGKLSIDVELPNGSRYGFSL
jgi:transcriptional regulator with XRE-family HTH domain